MLSQSTRERIERYTAGHNQDVKTAAWIARAILKTDLRPHELCNCLQPEFCQGHDAQTLVFFRACEALEQVREEYEHFIHAHNS